MGYILFSIILLIWSFWLVAKQKDFSLQVLYSLILVIPAVILTLYWFYFLTLSSTGMGGLVLISGDIILTLILIIISIVEWVISIIMKIKDQNKDKEKNNDYETAKMMPAEIKKFNWGALWFGGFWGALNQVWVALIAFILMNIPDYGIFFYIPFCIWLGFKGNELAWKAKRWESVEHFQYTQIRWAIIGWIIGLYLLQRIIGWIFNLF